MKKSLQLRVKKKRKNHLNLKILRLKIKRKNRLKKRNKRKLQLLRNQKKNLQAVDVAVGIQMKVTKRNLIQPKKKKQQNHQIMKPLKNLKRVKKQNPPKKKKKQLPQPIRRSQQKRTLNQQQLDVADEVGMLMNLIQPVKNQKRRTQLNRIQNHRKMKANRMINQPEKSPMQVMRKKKKN